MNRIKQAIAVAVVLASCAAPVPAANRALLHGVDYGNAVENWHFESTQIQVALTIWLNEWPFASVTKGDRKSTSAMILADFNAVPVLGANDFFLYYYSGHGNFEKRVNMFGQNEACNPNIPAAIPDNGAGGPALNLPCDEMLSPFTPFNGVIYDDDFVGLFKANNVKDPKKLAIMSSCFGGGMSNGHDVPGTGDGDLEQEGKTSMISGINENELMSGAPTFNVAILDAFKPVLVGAVPNQKWRPNADENGGNQNGDLTVQELWDFILTKTPQNAGGAKRYGADKCDCPKLPGGMGGNPHSPPPRGIGGVFDPRFYDDGNVAAKVLAKEVAKAVLVDTDGDGLYDHQEVGFGTDPTKADTDGDGVSDYDELVHKGTDPLKKDTDGDGNQDGGDCAPVDPTNPIPQEVPLIEVGPGGQIDWVAATGAASSDLLPRLLSGLPVGPGGGDESCLLASQPVAAFTDSAVPPAGAGYWYEVRGKNACGVGKYGDSSQGVRISSTCAP